MTQEKTVNVEELRKGGVVELKDKDMYSIWVKTVCCNLNSRQLRKLADISEKYGRGYLLFTTRQIPIIPFINLKDVAAVKQELNWVEMQLDRCGPRVRNVNVCYEDKICPEAITNCLSLGEELDNFFYNPILHKIKIGVAGCKKDCIYSKVLTDIGFVAREQGNKIGYDAYVGGRLGVNASVGVRIAECLPEKSCVKFVQNYFELLKKEGKEGERCADLLNRLGVERVRQELSNNIEEGLALQQIECKTRLEEKATEEIVLRIRATCGEVNSKQLLLIADIAEKYGRGIIHFAVRGSPEIPSISIKHLESIKEELKTLDLQIIDGGIDNLQSCFGNYCTESIADPQSLLRRIESKVEELGLNDLNIKISAAGCPNSCGIAQLSDIGFYGVVEPEVDTTRCMEGCRLCLAICKKKAIQKTGGLLTIDKEQCKYCGQCIAICPFDAILEGRKGFAVFAGCEEGEEMKLGELIAEFLSEDEVLQLTERCLRIVKEKKVNIATVIDERGIDGFKEMLGASTKQAY